MALFTYKKTEKIKQNSFTTIFLKKNSMHKHITVQLNRPLLLESALSKGLEARINPGF